MENKYEKIINNNPAESYLKSLKTKQAWDKYAYNFKQGMKHRRRMDKLTGNKEDKFGLKEETKKEYCNELSTTRLGKALKKLQMSSFVSDTQEEFRASRLDNLAPDGVYMVVEEHPLIKKDDYFYGHLLDKENGDLGNFEYTTSDERFPDYIFIEDMHKENTGFTQSFAAEVFVKLREKYKNDFKGIVLLPVNEKLVEHYKNIGFKLYKSIGDDFYYKRDF